jgi:CDP-paratose 2-epimerase
MKLFITGGAGFIGCNSADRFLRDGHEVTIFDNLSRAGAQANLDWLHESHGERLCFIKGDVRDYQELIDAIAKTDVVLHLASQVAVTSSVENPRTDFEVNALGTFNVLEAVRNANPKAAVLYASTNKVYGGMEGVGIIEQASRYAYADFTQGIPENFPLDFHSPYGCSKGTGDQYAIDYARIYGLRTLVLRQSCIYGRRQFGIEDQGWLAHLIISANTRRPITIYGDGKQVRDVLHVSDLVKAFQLGIEQIDSISGWALNVGGGPDNSISIWAEFGPFLESLAGRPIEVDYQPWRPGDQRVFIANVDRARAALGWRPSISPTEGITDLWNWVTSHQELF